MTHPGDAPYKSIKRAPVMYGRRSNPNPPSTDEPECGRPPAAPSQQRALSDALDSKHSPSPGATDSFQFGFRHRLKELDEQFDNDDAQSLKPGPSVLSQVTTTEPSQVTDPQSISMSTPTLSSEARHLSGDPTHASLTPSPTRLRATSDQERSPGDPRARRRTRRVQIPSDSEPEEPSNSSSVSPVRHAITTPHSRSSPTPPTSGEIPKISRKAMGKAPARDVLPLHFDVERPSAVELPARSKKGRRSELLLRTKMKAPTKKERREAAFESSRIAASRPVEVIRTQEQKHSLAAFFAGLQRDNIVTLPPGTELSSDPIERFSSPTDSPTRVPPLDTVFGAPTELLRPAAYVATMNQPSPSENVKTLLPAEDDSDDEMPSVTSIIQQAGGRQRRLQVIKQVALQHANTSNPFEIDNEDDDLLIVKDDMHAVAREEAAQRRLDRAHRSPAKDIISLRKIKHPSVRPAMVSPRKLSKQGLQELAKPSFSRERKGAKDQLSKKQLDQLMIAQHAQEQLKSIRRHEEEWIKGGGKLSRNTGGDSAQTSLLQRLVACAEQGLKAIRSGDAVWEEVSADENDGDYTDLQESPSPDLMDAVDDGGEPTDSTETLQASQQLVGDDDDDDDEGVAPLRHNKSGQRNPRLALESDDEGDRAVHRNLPTVQKDSTSSMESQTEDENDKENSARLMYDRSEDKENKAVVRHELSSSEPALRSRGGSPQRVEDGIPRNLPLTSTVDSTNTTYSSKENVRSPLKDILKDKGDLLLSPPPSNPPLTEGLLHGAIASPPRVSTSMLSLGSLPVLRSEHVGRINRLSLDSENDENDPSGFKLLQPSFLERLHRQVGPEFSSAPINPVPDGGFSQLFSAEDKSLKKSVDGAENNGLSLTLDVALKPALEVKGTLRQKAETIFEKDQECVVAAAVQKSDRSKEPLYVNDHGFLTQTRPDGSSPQVYRITPSQAPPKSIPTQAHPMQTQLPGARPPLRTLSLTVSQELSPESQPLRRLRRRSSSPLEHKTPGRNSTPVAQLNAFSILGKAPKLPAKAQKERYEKSEFVAVEAEESDDDDMFGFGGPKNVDEGDDDDGQDKVVEGLVDDTVMDVETEAADLVQQKYREHEEEDDQKVQRLHQDAIQGKLRMKRRGRGISLEDDSEEDDDDDDAHRIRRRIHKKRKIEGDSLEALGQNEETKAFYNTYHQDLVDEEDEFGHLRENVAMFEDNVQAEESGERESVSVVEIQKHLRDLAQNNPEVGVLDPEDTSWIDQSTVAEADDAVRVKVVEHRSNKSTARHLNAGLMTAFDAERPKRHMESEQERKQMVSWAKNQSHQRQLGTGRSGGSTAVTGHAKAKAGGGSLRSRQQSNPTSVHEACKTKNSSLLSAVSSRKDKFG